MLNHKFYFADADKEEKDCYIRISCMFMKKIWKSLAQYKFIWNGYDDPQYGFSDDITIITPEKLQQVKECIIKEKIFDKESCKLMKLIEKGISDNKEVIHENGNPGNMVHDFVICSEFPERVDYNDYRGKFIEIQDQFILDYYDVFKTVDLYWDNLKNKKEGLNYYGMTIITSHMARELLNAMENFLKNNTSEKAEYFAGEDYDKLAAVLNKAMTEDGVIIHFGI